MYKILEISSIDTTDELWREYHRIQLNLHEKFGSSYKLTDWRELKKTILSFIAKEKNYQRILIRNGERLVGWAEMKLFNANTPDKLLSIRFDADYEVVPPELSKVLAEFFFEGIMKYEVSQLFYITQDKRAIKTAFSWGGEKMHRNDEYVLYRDRADIALMKSWMDSIPSKNPDLVMRFFPETPEVYYEQFARVLSQCLNDMPEERDSRVKFNVNVEELKQQVIWRRQNNIPSYKYIIFNQWEEIVGLTLAELRVKYPKEASQAMTGVVEQYRGRGLAKWLKAAMYFKLGEDFPENKKIITMMRAVNEPIQHINMQMGYVLEREGMELEISKEKLARFLSK